jgi:hypothetical protein
MTTTTEGDFENEPNGNICEWCDRRDNGRPPRVWSVHPLGDYICEECFNLRWQSDTEYWRDVRAAWAAEKKS